MFGIQNSSYAKQKSIDFLQGVRVSAFLAHQQAFLVRVLRIFSSDAALFSPRVRTVAKMADFVLADDLAHLVAYRNLQTLPEKSIRWHETVSV